MESNIDAATSTSTRPLAPPLEHRWMSVVFMQGEEADRVLDMIDRAGPERAIRHLSQWDFGDETRDSALVNGYVYDKIPESPTDRVVRDHATGYALTYNHRFGYVSLLRTFSPVEQDARRPKSPQAPWFALAGRSTSRRRPGLTL